MDGERRLLALVGDSWLARMVLLGVLIGTILLFAPLIWAWEACYWWGSKDP